MYDKKPGIFKCLERPIGGSRFSPFSPVPGSPGLIRRTVVIFTAGTALGKFLFPIFCGVLLFPPFSPFFFTHGLAVSGRGREELDGCRGFFNGSVFFLFPPPYPFPRGIIIRVGRKPTCSVPGCFSVPPPSGAFFFFFTLFSFHAELFFQRKNGTTPLSYNNERIFVPGFFTESG